MDTIDMWRMRWLFGIPLGTLTYDHPGGTVAALEDELADMVEEARGVRRGPRYANLRALMCGAT